MRVRETSKNAIRKIFGHPLNFWVKSPMMKSMVKNLLMGKFSHLGFYYGWLVATKEDFELTSSWQVWWVGYQWLKSFGYHDLRGLLNAPCCWSTKLEIVHQSNRNWLPSYRVTNAQRSVFIESKNSQKFCIFFAESQATRWLSRFLLCMLQKIKQCYEV